MHASPAWRRACRPADRRLTTLVLLCLVTSLVSMVWRHRHHTSGHQCGRPSFCRPDMSVSVLPPMSGDDLTLTRQLFTYLTSPDPAACRRLAKLGGTTKLRDDNIPILDGQKSVCMDGEFASLFDRNCLIYTVQNMTDRWLDQDIANFDCQVEHISFPTFTITNDISTRGDWPDLTRTLAGPGHRRDLPISLLAVSDPAERGLSLLKLEVDREAESVLGGRVQQLVVRLNFSRHLPVSDHVAFYRDLYSTLLRLQSLGFYPFANEPNYLTQANMAAPGLEERTYPSMDVAWMKTACFPPVKCNN